MLRVLIAAGLALTAASGFSLAQDAAMEIGKREYMVACAGCHGETGKGTGPIAQLMTIETPDLTAIKSRMETEGFPYENTIMLIDGRSGIRAHGGDMPVWGERYMGFVRENDTAWLTPESAELIIKGRILALVQYLESIQE